MNFKSFSDILEAIHISMIVIYPIINFLLPKRLTGRPRSSMELAIFTIFYKIKTGVQWKNIPKGKYFLPASTAHDWFQRFLNAGVFELLFTVIAELYDYIVGYAYTIQSADGTHLQAPVRGIERDTEGVGPSPVNRSFPGSKISMLVDKIGVPMGFTISGANIHDSKLLEKTLQDAINHGIFAKNKNKDCTLMLDKGYDGQPSEAIAFKFGYYADILSRGEEKKEKNNGISPRRWVVERTHAWEKGFHDVRTRYTQKLSNFFGEVRFSSGMMILRKILNVASTDQLSSAMEKIDMRYDWQTMRKLVDIHAHVIGQNA